MRIAIACPAPRGSRRGNRVTAERWARMLRALGHRVSVSERPGPNVDLLIALHAVKTAEIVERAVGRTRIVVVLTGTDFEPRLSAVALRTLARADRIVMLYPAARPPIPLELQPKLRVVMQSAEAPRGRKRRDGRFRAVVAGHLRAVKDPFRTALAARRARSDSRLEVLHLGAALVPEMAERARREMRRNPRYRWLGEVSRARTLRLVAGADVFVLSSRAEGGASALSEAIAAGVPVLATRIPSVEALLGADYPGLFGVGATGELAALLERVERDASFAKRLRRRVIARRRLVSPAREQAALRRLVADFATSPG